MKHRSLDTYNKLTHDNITKAYKHRSEGTISQITDQRESNPCLLIAGLVVILDCRVSRIAV